jgi:exo-beta-1,3-glucanase (GH17 family)
MLRSKFIILALLASLLTACSQPSQVPKEIQMSKPSAAEIFGNPDYPAFSYGGYRGRSREQTPTRVELAEDMKILSAMGIRILRTYNTSQYPQAARLLSVIRELKRLDPEFQMYVMLGVWIEAENAWTDAVNHQKGNTKNNTAEIDAAVALAIEYPGIVKAIAVGNEAMVQWAVQYFVYPEIILKWVNYLQMLKHTKVLPADLWITSSDNYESWGGSSEHYRTADLKALIEAVDFVSVHTYPFHDSYYNQDYWGVLESEELLSEVDMIEASMLRASQYAIQQYESVVSYISSLGIEKAVHIGETGWASFSGGVYGETGSRAADEYKEKLYYQYVREWSDSNGITCFYFEAFDEQWKAGEDPSNSENHFGLITIQNQAKYALWDTLEQGRFDGLTRNGKALIKSYGGDEKALMEDVLRPPFKRQMSVRRITNVNNEAVIGQAVSQANYVVIHESMLPPMEANMTYPSSSLKLNPWEGTSSIDLSHQGIIKVVTGKGDWWGSALEIDHDTGENLSAFASGYLHLDIRGDAGLEFNIGFQTGKYLAGTQVNNFVVFGTDSGNVLNEQWVSYSFPMMELNRGADLTDVSSVLYLWSDTRAEHKQINIRNVYYSKQ